MLEIIPLVVMTASTAEADLLRAQELKANSYITKPVESMKFLEVVRGVEDFYFFVVTLPHVSRPGDTVLVGN
jgi:CheY-like chemotaxis protein